MPLTMRLTTERWTVEAETRAYEIRMRSARKAGELLKATEKAKASPWNQYTGKWTGQKILPVQKPSIN